MKFKPITCLLVCLLFLTACRTNRQVVENSNTEKIEKTESKITYRDTVFYTPKTEASIALPILDFKQDLKYISIPKIYTQKNGNAKATIRAIRDSIFVEAECDSVQLQAKIKKEQYSQLINNEWRHEIVSEKEKKVNWGLITGLILISFIAGFITKSLIKISI